jgi:periplasmic divalent cation tolerance protein
VNPASDNPASNAGGVLLVLTNCPDEATAAHIRRELVQARLAACVNQLGPVQSTYRWQGAVEEISEITLLIKTTRERYLDLEARLRQLHPYSVPEIVAISVEGGSSDYLAWVEAETRAGVSQAG